ncbi:SRPBCC family protein [Nocardioides sp.]|uniref:SRPBCC family protein n=1 Tax=Nocardioides sp. TaxID=35761 RepID=UPI002732C43E|nr:SRPBCC family protein [Nocardioides sp.]MDP3890028.1 SRPBCC family protein [Nocardioides sp.]
MSTSSPTSSPTSSSTDPARELRAEVVVAAPPRVVWQALTDLRAMATWSPELVRMVALKPGGLRRGQWYVGVNRRGAFVWPTRNVVAVLDPERTLAWDTPTSGARWVYELAAEGEGTRVVHRRPVPEGPSRLSSLVAGLLLGGAAEHAEELEQGMARTLEGLRAAAERASAA